MSYPPGSPGYPPAQQPTTQFAAPTQQLGKIAEPNGGAADGPTKLPLYLTAAVAVLGLAVYLSSFGPYFTASAGVGAELFTPTPLYFGLVGAVLAGLLAGVALLPKQPVRYALIAVLAVLGLLMSLAIVITVPSGISIAWGLYLIIAFSAVQAIVAVVALLFETGVITPPAPRPKYEQQYGQYGSPGPYYGQPQGQPHHGGGQPPQQGLHQQQQRPGGYPAQYGGYPGGQSGGGYSAGGPQSGPPTPPTGFPTYGQPQQSPGATPGQPAQPQSSQQSGQSPS